MIRQKPIVNTELKKSLSSVLAEELRARISGGGLGPEMPGVRLISKAYGVSVPTASKAMQWLAEEGVLESRGGRRNWRVASGHGAPTSVTADRGVTRRGSKGNLLVLSAFGLGEERYTNSQFVTELLNALGATGWEARHRVLNFEHAKRPKRAWGELLKSMEPDAVVVVGGTDCVARWLAQQKVRSLFVGGDAGQTGIPLLALSAGEMYRRAVKHLLELGHRRILTSFCGRLPGFVERCTRAIQETLEESGADSGSMKIVETPYSGPEVTANLLRRNWPKYQPDALIFLDWREFLAASGFLREAGLTIPRDISVVILSHSSSMEWHIPRLSHFELPHRELARLAGRWVTDGKLPKSIRNLVRVTPRWVEGDSIAKRRP